MTEANARVLLLNLSSVGGLEGWMAKQLWRVEAGGWAVMAELKGWRLRVEIIAQGLPIHTGEPGATPAVWVVTE